MSFGEKIMDYKEDIITDLADLIAIQSVTGIQEKTKEALDWVMRKALSFGLDVMSYNDAAGHAQIGEGGKLCGVLTHLDVVSEGNNWNSLPFELSVGDNGYMYGRGVADDKGAALITLYCLKALKDNGVVGKNTLRAIFGTAEERGMTDMEEYFKHEPVPELSFTPDSEYGICKGEKGILQLELYCDHDGTTLTQLHSGKTVNAVPDTAYALLDCSENEDHQLARLADAKRGSFEFYYTIDGMMVLSRGRAAHACDPDKGLNAATALIDLLTSNFALSTMGTLPSFISHYIGVDTDGVMLGLKMRDNESGPLTVNVGTVHIDDSYATCTLDIRYPVTADGEKILADLRRQAEKEGVTVKVLSHQKPLYLDEDAPIVKLLSESYENIMGEKPGLYTTGGGTYARKLGGNGVAFGPIFEGEESNIHNANECINVEKFFKHAQICLESMYNLYTKG